MKTLFILPRKNKEEAESAAHLANTLQALESLTDLHTLCLASRSFFKKIIKRDVRFIIDYVQKHSISFIWFSEGFFSYRLIKAIKRINPNLRIIVESTQLSSRKQFESLSLSVKSPSQKMIKQVLKKEAKEKSLIKLCDILTAPSESEAIYYRNLSGERDKIVAFTKGVLPTTPILSHSVQKPLLMLLGRYHPTSLSMSWATKWFLEKILPLVKKHIPELSCAMVCTDNKLIGKSAEWSFIDEKSSLTYLSQSTVALRIVPEDNLTRFLEAFAYKIPVVATTLGIGPLPFEDGEHIMIADTPEKFAANIIKLIEDKAFAAYIAEKCYQKVHELYGIERLKKDAQQIFARIE